MSLKTYRWLDFRAGVGQVDCLMAADSGAQICRILGVKRHTLFNFSETRNAEDIRLATANPRVLYWKSTRGKYADPWNKDASEEAQ